MTDYKYGHESLEDKMLCQNVPGRLHTWEHDADEVEGKKSIYVTLVAGLIVVAFVAPMLQFFYYTGGD